MSDFFPLLPVLSRCFGGGQPRPLSDPALIRGGGAATSDLCPERQPARQRQTGHM